MKTDATATRTRQDCFAVKTGTSLTISSRTADRNSVAKQGKTDSDRHERWSIIARYNQNDPRLAYEALLTRLNGNH